MRERLRLLRGKESRAGHDSSGRGHSPRLSSAHLPSVTGSPLSVASLLSHSSEEAVCGDSLRRSSRSRASPLPAAVPFACPASSSRPLLLAVSAGPLSLSHPSNDFQGEAPGWRQFQLVVLQLHLRHLPSLLLRRLHPPAERPHLLVQLAHLLCHAHRLPQGQRRSDLHRLRRRPQLLPLRQLRTQEGLQAPAPHGLHTRLAVRVLLRTPGVHTRQTEGQRQRQREREGEEEGHGAGAVGGEGRGRHQRTRPRD